MQKVMSIFALVVMALLAACAGTQTSPPTIDQTDRPIITVYTSPT